MLISDVLQRLLERLFCKRGKFVYHSYYATSEVSSRCWKCGERLLSG